MFLKRHTGVSEPAIHRSSTQNRCFWIIHKIHSKKPVLESLFNKAAVLRTCNFIKEDSNTVAFLWNLQNFLKIIILKNILWISVSKQYLKRDSNTGAFLRILWIIQEHLFSRGSTNSWLRNSNGFFFFNKAAILTAWRLLIVLERDCRTVISLWILRNF